MTMIELNTFAEVCYHKKGFYELLEAFYSGEADQIDCQFWNLDNQQWLDQIGVALAQQMRDFLIENKTSDLVDLINNWVNNHTALEDRLQIDEEGDIVAPSGGAQNIYRVAEFFKTHTPHKTKPPEEFGVAKAKDSHEILVLDESEIPASFDAATLYLNGKAIISADEETNISHEDIGDIASNLSEALGGVQITECKIYLRDLASACAEARGEIEQFNKDMALAKDGKGDVDIDDVFDLLDAWTQGYTNANAYQAYQNSLEK